MERTVRECEICKEGIQAQIEANAKEARLAVVTAAKIAEESVKAIRREFRQGLTISTTLIAIFITILEVINLTR